MPVGKANQVFPALQADDCFIITPSPTLDVADDPNNVTNKYGQVVLKNNTAVDVTATVITVHGTATIDILIKSGAVEPIAVRRVTAATGQLLGYVGHQKV